MAYLNSKLNENNWTYSLAEVTIGTLLAKGSQKWSRLCDATNSLNSTAVQPQQVNGGSKFVLLLLRFGWRT